jgi:hypothetical protein
MFVGHYGVSFSAKRVEQSIPLWVLFLAVQFLDVLWAPFILLGIEKVRIVPGFTASDLRGRLARSLGTLVFGVLMLGIQAYIFFGPPPTSDRAAASTALIAYAVFAIVIWWLQDRTRRFPTSTRCTT